MNGLKSETGRSRFRGAETIFFAMIAEMDLVVKNLIFSARGVQRCIVHGRDRSDDP